VPTNKPALRWRRGTLAPMVAPALLDAYHRTTYSAHPPGRLVTVRPGEPCASLDALLRPEQSTWAHVTAWNPEGVVLPAKENARRQAELEQVVAEAGYLALPGWGCGDDGHPPERGVLVLGIPHDEAVALGRRFAQLAVVVGVRGGVPRILPCQG